MIDFVIFKSPLGFPGSLGLEMQTGLGALRSGPCDVARGSVCLGQRCVSGPPAATGHQVVPYLLL